MFASKHKASLARRFFQFIRIFMQRWNEDHVTSYAASLAYYSLFALTPIVIICTVLIGLTFGRGIAQTQILNMITLAIGQDGAQQIQTMIDVSSKPFEGFGAEIIGFIILFIGASGIFTEIKVGLNVIFPAPPSEQDDTLIKWIIDRFLAFSLVLGVACLLFASLIFSAVLSFLSHYVASFSYIGIAISWLLDFSLSFILVSLMLGLVYKVLPDMQLKWSEVSFGACIAAFLFIVGKFLLAFYLGRKHINTAFGPAGALVIILIWLYYSALILFLGAELIRIRKFYLSRSEDEPNPSQDKITKIS
ncbi:MAG: hypothetical protein BGO90_08335 [Legionella sp. 40-6]|nr:YihY/virulence factor BrkB family protein [Legionella sp.]OJY32156.1 MAG: hypothetical protein BGO90_08335 [Legionella sp. 40-6]